MLRNLRGSTAALKTGRAFRWPVLRQSRQLLPENLDLSGATAV